MNRVTLIFLFATVGNLGWGVEFTLQARAGLSTGEKQFTRKASPKDPRGELPLVAKHYGCGYLLEGDRLTVTCKALPGKESGGSSSFLCPKGRTGVLGTGAVFGKNEVWRYQVSCTH